MNGNSQGGIPPWMREYQRENLGWQQGGMQHPGPGSSRMGPGPGARPMPPKRMPRKKNSGKKKKVLLIGSWVVTIVMAVVFLVAAGMYVVKYW